MVRKMTSALVVILALLLVTAMAWSSTFGDINPAGSGNILALDLGTTVDYPFILARGGNGGGGGQGGHGNGYGSGGHGNGSGDGDCDGDGHGPGPDATDNGYGSAAKGPGRGAGGSENR